MTKLSDTAQLILHGAANHEHGLARGPLKLPTAARNAVFKSLLKQNLLTDIAAPKEYIGLGWRQDEHGGWIVARITHDGLRAIGIEPFTDEQRRDMGEPDASGIEGSVPDAEGAALAAMAEEQVDQNGLRDQVDPHAEEIALLDETLARTAKPRASLRDAAEALLAAIDHDKVLGLGHWTDALRAALATKPSREQGATRAPRAGTKQDTVLAMLARDEGATGAQIAEATGWANNTVRGFLAGLKTKGHKVEVLDRVRQVGPNKTGAKGSYTVYRIGKEG